MAKYNNSKVEQEMELKDGRKLFRTHNGFKSYVEDKNGKVTEVTSEYFIKSKKNKK